MSLPRPLAAWLPLVGIVAIAVAVRLVHLATDPIWFDEAATIGIASMPWATIFGPMQQAESSPPGYYALAKLWSMAFGDSIVSLRMLSVSAGAAVAVPVWWLARASLGRHAALVAAGFTALAATHVRMSQDARCYTALVLGVGIAMQLAVRLAAALRSGRQPFLPALAFGVVIGLLLWLHATATLAGLALNVFAFALLWPDRRAMLRGIAWLAAANLLAVAVAWVPLQAMLAHVFAADEYADRWLLPPTPVDAARIYGRALIAPYLGDLSPWTALLQIGLMAAAALAWWRSRNPLLPALAAMLAAGGLALPLVSQMRPVMMDRTVLFLLLPMALLLGAGVQALGRRWRMPVAVLLLGLQAVGTWNWHHWPVRKEQWDLAAEALHARIRPGEMVILPDGAFVGISLARHLARIGAERPAMVVLPPRSPLEQLAAAELAPDHPKDLDTLCQRLAGTSPTVWVVLRDHPEAVEIDRDFTMVVPIRQRFTSAGGRMLEKVTVVGVELQRWKVPPCAGQGARAGG